MGLSKKKKFSNHRYTAVESTFYGFDHNNQWYLNGSSLYGQTDVKNGEKLYKINDYDKLRRCGNIILDIYFDGDNDGGKLKIKPVASQWIHFNEDDTEIIISNINNCPDNDTKEWIPHFIFGNYSTNHQQAMFAAIPVSWYGIDKPIDWK